MERCNTYSFGFNLAVLNAVIVGRGLTPGRINATVDDGEGNVNTFGAKLAGEGLGDASLGKLASGESGEAGGAAEGGGGAGDDEGGGMGG